jgi:copper chaperone CopZ
MLSSTPAPPTVTPLPRAVATPARSAAATPTPRAANLKTFHTQIVFATYETEETVQSELGRLPGVASVSVSQLDVTVEYDAARLTPDDILRTLRANPEVRIKE